MSTQLPNWVYDVVIQLQKWSDEHGDLYMKRYDGEYVKENDCCLALHMVPDDVKKVAAAIGEYKLRAAVSDES